MAQMRAESAESATENGLIALTVCGGNGVRVVHRTEAPISCALSALMALLPHT